jgi:hypothetical protein
MCLCSATYNYICNFCDSKLNKVYIFWKSDLCKVFAYVLKLFFLLNIFNIILEISSFLTYMKL